jgi:hypothetical protein
LRREFETTMAERVAQLPIGRVPDQEAIAGKGLGKIKKKLHLFVKGTFPHTTSPQHVSLQHSTMGAYAAGHSHLSPPLCCGIHLALVPARGEAARNPFLFPPGKVNVYINAIYMPPDVFLMSLSRTSPCQPIPSKIATLRFHRLHDSQSIRHAIFHGFSFSQFTDLFFNSISTQRNVFFLTRNPLCFFALAFLLFSSGRRKNTLYLYAFLCFWNGSNDYMVFLSLDRFLFRDDQFLL